MLQRNVSGDRRKIKIRDKKVILTGEVISDDEDTYCVELLVAARWFIFPLTVAVQFEIDKDDIDVISVEPPKCEVEASLLSVRFL